MSTGWILLAWLAVTVLIDVVTTWRERKVWERCLDEPGSAEAIRLSLFRKWTLGMVLWPVGTVVVVRSTVDDPWSALGVRLPEFDGLRAGVGSAYYAVLAGLAVVAIALAAWLLHASWNATPRRRDVPNRQAALDLASFPSSQSGRVWYRLFTLTSTVFTELHYRGLAFLALGFLVPDLPSAVLVLVAVVLTVNTQGAGRLQAGIVAGILAIPLAVLYLWTGSLFPGIFLYTLLGWANLNTLAEPSAPRPTP